jgi:lysophospholipase L1-like esterase
MNMVRKTRQWIAVLSTVVLLTASGVAQQKWVGSWAASQQLVEPRNSVAATDLKDVTLRQIVHLTIGGPRLRLHLSNRYGVEPLHIDSVHIARAVAPASSKIVSGSDEPLTFSGHPDVTIPAGADYVSDPIRYPSPSFADLAITIHLDAIPNDQTGHPGSRATSYLAHGDHVSAPELADAKQIEHWYFIEGIDVVAPERAEAVVTLGDSITDGHAATTNGNDRWPDDLARRLQANHRTAEISVLNHGIGGNRLLLDGLGPNALARFDHDVLAQAGARYLLVLEGVNDLGMFGRMGEHTAAERHELVEQMIGAYKQIITRAHTNGVKVAGCTITPFVGSGFYHPDANEEADRQTINKWIRTPGHFDEVIDFDRVVRDPVSPDRLLPKFDSGDHLHPSPAGYAAMANAIRLDFFTQAPPKPHVRPVAQRSAPQVK